MIKENILGFDVCNISKEEITKQIFEDFNNNISNFIVNINPEIVLQYYKNNNIKQIFNNQKYQIADGTGIIWASKKKKGNIKERITGIDLMEALCMESVKNESRIFLYGSKPGIADKASEELRKKYDKINIVGFCNGYENEENVLEKINACSPNIVFVGLGSPKQEEFIIKNKDKLKNVKILMPVGGSFDVISKTLKRAPNWIIKCNLEWLYRLLKQPKRFFRQLKLFKFVYLILIRRK